MGTFDLLLGRYLDDDRCRWCGIHFHKQKKYAFHLCLNCYRWFRRYKEKEILRCIVCTKVIRSYQRGICKNCKEDIIKVSKPSKRTNNIREKFTSLVPELEDLNSYEEAYQIFSPYFKPKQTIFLEIALERFFNGHTLASIGNRHGWSREYVRQCEEKALLIIQEREEQDDIFTELDDETPPI